MKKTLLLPFLLLSFSKLHAQTTPWVSQGATWFYTWVIPGAAGNDKIVYTNDTVIFGKTCEVLRTTRYTYGQAAAGEPVSLISTAELPSNYTYSNGDTVFYFNNGNFHVLYNFGAQVNDTWNLGVDTNGTYCSRSIVKVDSLSTIVINAVTHKVLYTSDSAKSSVGITGKIIEHIGSMNYLFPEERNCNPQIVVDFPIYNFSCFQDSTVTYRLVSPEECANPYHVGTAEYADQEEIKYFPNPVSDKLYIRFAEEKNCRICIYNVLGEKIIETKHQKSKSVTIDMSNVEPGIYFSTLEDNLGKKINNRVIKK